MKTYKTETKLLQLKTLQESSGNPQKMNDKTFTGLVDSIKRKGWYFAMPDVWEYKPNKYRIISGHHRLKAAIEAGIVEQNCNVIKDKRYTEAQARKDLLESNERHGDPDPDLLQDFVIDLVDNFDVNIDDLVDDIGFDDSILNDILSQDDEKDDEVPEVPEVAFSKLGDLYLLNGHRVLCGDSTDKAQVDLLMDGKKADMVFTDPPYGINEKGDRSNRGGNSKIVGDMKGLKLKDFKDETTDYAIKAFNICMKLNIKRQVWWGGNYYCHSMPETGNWFVWDKRVEEKHNNTNSDCELAWVKSEFSSVRVFRHLWNGICKGSEMGQKRIHPTQKPIALAVWAFGYFKKVVSVIDLFLGSGSTLIAAEKTNRTCYGMEIDPHYIDVTIKRYINYTGTKDNCFLIRDNKKIPLSDIKELNNG